MQTLRKRANLAPDIVPGGGNQYGEAIHRAEVAINRIVALTAAVAPVAPPDVDGPSVTSLATLTGAILLAALNNVIISLSEHGITIEGRIGPRLGFRWPSAGENINIDDSDHTIYGTSARHCGSVTFPAASSCPGKYVLFSYAPGGGLGGGTTTTPTTTGGGTTGGSGATLSSDALTPASTTTPGGTDTVDAFSGSQAAYQSDGVSRWVRVLTIP